MLGDFAPGMEEQRAQQIKKIAGTGACVLASFDERADTDQHTTEVKK